MIAERKRQDKMLVGTPRGVPGRRDGKDVRLGRWLPSAAVEGCRAPRDDVQKAKEPAWREEVEKHGSYHDTSCRGCARYAPRAADACVYARHCKITASKTITLQPNSSRNPTMGQ